MGRDAGGMRDRVDIECSRDMIEYEMRCVGVGDAIERMTRSEYLEPTRSSNDSLQCTERVRTLDIGCLEDLIA